MSLVACNKHPEGDKMPHEKEYAAYMHYHALTIKALEKGSKWSGSLRMGGFDWKFDLFVDTEDDEKYLMGLLTCNEKAKRTNWSCEVLFGISSLYSDEYNSSPNLIPRDSIDQRIQFTPTIRAIKCKLWKWSMIKDEFDETEDFTATYSARIVASKGVYCPRLYLFNSNTNGPADTILLVKGDKIAVSAGFLAMYSPFFYRMFYTDKGKKHNEIFSSMHENVEQFGQFDYALPVEIKSTDFINLLKLVYPKKQPPTEKNVESILNLAIRLEFDIAKKRCDKFIAKTKNMSILVKVELAVSYNLPITMEQMDEILCSVPKIEDAMESRHYRFEMPEKGKKMMKERLKELKEKMKAQTSEILVPATLTPE